MYGRRNRSDGPSSIRGGPGGGAAPDKVCYKSLISYYLREGLYQHVVDEATSQIKKRGNDSYLLFWKAFALGMQGCVPEAIREFESIKSKRDVEYGVVVALLHFHGKAKMIDREAVEMLSATLTITEDMASDHATLAAAQFLWLTGNLTDARYLVEKVMGDLGEAQTPIQQQAFTLRGWIGASVKNPQNKAEIDLHKESIRYFEGSGQPRDLDTVMGKAFYFSSGLKGLPEAQDHLNHAIALQSRFWPALAEKAKLLMAAGEWEQASDAVARILEMDQGNIHALQLRGLHAITQAGEAQGEGINCLRRLSESLSNQEPQNAPLHLSMSKPLARVCGRDPVLLQLTIGMLEGLKDDNPTLLVELGYQFSLLGAYDSAIEAYQAATKLDQSDVRAMTGVIYCQVQDGDLEDAAQQLEFLTVLQDSIGSCPELSLVRALLKFRLDRDMDQHVKLLDECREQLEMSAKEGSRITDIRRRLCAVNPDLMLEIAKEYLLHASSGVGSAGVRKDTRRPGYSSSSPGDWTLCVESLPVVSPLDKGLDLLQRVVQLVPGHLDARLTMARAYFSTGQTDLAHHTLQTLLGVDAGQQKAHLLAAQVYLAQGNFRAASTSLEQALSCDFRVRKSPLYHLVRAQVLTEQGALEEALETLEEALRYVPLRSSLLPGVRDGMATSSGTSQGGVSLAANNDRAAIFVNAIRVLAKLKRTADANELVKEAMALFQGTPDEVQIVIANSELAIERGDFDKAIAVLGDVPKTSPSYVNVQMVKANVYITLRRDRRAYAQCYRDMAQSDPSPMTYDLLGEAYMRIQMPEAAIDSFEIALEMDPSDAALAGKIGCALVSTHDYRRAVDYYRKAVRGAPRNTSLRHDLARLCLKLRRFEDASGVLEEGMTEDRSDLEAMRSDVQTLLIAAEVHQAAGRNDLSEEALAKAQDLQGSVLDRVRSESTDRITEAKSLLARICREQAKLMSNINTNEEQALHFYKAALRADDVDEESMIGLARAHLRRNEPEECEQFCNTALRVSGGENEEAKMVLAEVVFLRGQHGKAIQCYEDVLRKSPNNYTALSKIIGLLRRAGQLSQVPTLLSSAERGDPRSSAHAGLRYCRGLYLRYTNDMHEAVRNLNLVRRDGEWGARALEHMIEIYLSPNGDPIWETPAGDSASESVEVAEKLLSELKVVGGAEDGRGSLRISRAIENVVNMASRDKDKIDEAMTGFIGILEDEKDYLPSLLGMSAAFMMEEAPNKARNALKRIAKMPYTADMAEEFEQAYLHLAELYIDRGKFDLAQDLCRRCLSYNKSCPKAWETMGLVMEKELSYKDAADCYEKSWTFSNQASAAVGFKLAFNYLKARRFVEAIDVCNKVLTQYPDYPKMREEILSPAQSSLRP
ncbi:unnamed protein product [Discosporangium mesarthrocarpum]